MNRQTLHWKITILLSVLTLIATGCARSGGSGETSVWIDVPVHGLTIPLGETINIEGHAFDPGGVSRVEIWIDSELTWTIEELPQQGDLVSFSQTWTPAEAGTYIILVAATGASGSSTPDSVTVQAGGSTPEPDEPEATETPTVTSTATEDAAGEMTVEYWADPAEIDAGACSTLHWQVENTQKVMLGNTKVDPQGSYEVCLCETSSYRLTVTDLDGVDEVFKATIQVNGVCVTPTTEVDETPPAVDEIPPAAPVLLKPLNGADIGQVPDTMLRWEAVSDESGIDEYQIQVQRHGGDFIWETAPGSPFTGIGATQKLFSVEYGYTYRWRVRAIDGAGNPGSWSGWFTFIVPLT